MPLTAPLATLDYDDETLVAFHMGRPVTILGVTDHPEDTYWATYGTDPHGPVVEIADCSIDWVRPDGTVVGGVWADGIAR